MRQTGLPSKWARSPRVSPDAIEHALAVAEHLSFRDAAAALGVGQSAVSRRIRMLEDQLGVSLFERRRTGVRLTNAGAQYLQRVREAFRQFEWAAELAAAAGQGATGSLGIAFVSSIGKGFLHDLVTVYSDQHREIAISVCEAALHELLPLVRRRQVDVALIPDATRVTGCDCMPLWRERLYVVLPEGHKLSEREQVSWSDLRAERFILRRATYGRLICERALKQVCDLAPRVEEVDVGRDTLIHFVAIRKGVSLAGEALTTTTFPNVVFRPIAGGHDRLEYSAVWLPGNDNPALRRFLSLARVRAKAALSNT
jgi:DNA-binding transcriptional LysR family regulator